jgi:hypothetical protein
MTQVTKIVFDRSHDTGQSKADRALLAGATLRW